MWCILDKAFSLLQKLFLCHVAAFLWGLLVPGTHFWNCPFANLAAGNKTYNLKLRPFPRFRDGNLENLPFTA